MFAPGGPLNGVIGCEPSVGRSVLRKVRQGDVVRGLHEQRGQGRHQVALVVSPVVASGSSVQR
jgi:hypothetical protein